jgi:hypothetical protein
MKQMLNHREVLMYHLTLEQVQTIGFLVLNCSLMGKFFWAEDLLNTTEQAETALHV